MVEAMERSRPSGVVRVRLPVREEGGYSRRERGQAKEQAPLNRLSQTDERELKLMPMPML